MYAIRTPSGEIATLTGGPSTGWLTELVSGAGSMRFRTSPFCRMRRISLPLPTAMVPSSACDGERYGSAAVPSVVTW